MSCVLATGQVLPDSIWIAISAVVGVVAFAVLSWAFVKIDKRLRRRV